MTHTLDLTADIIDVRDIIERYETLEADLLACYNEQSRDQDGEDYEELTDSEEMAFRMWLRETVHEDAEEFNQLLDILEELKGNGGDEQWRGDWYPVTLIRDGSAFEEYMDELLEDCGDIPKWDKLPSYVRITIDYDQLKWDYTTIEIDGDDYLYR